MEVYRVTRRFPPEERFNLSSQMRRAATSIACNIVEGSSRRSQSDYVRFLEVSLGSAKELCYQMTLAERLGYFASTEDENVVSDAHEAIRLLAGLVHALDARKRPLPSSL